MSEMLQERIDFSNLMDRFFHSYYSRRPVNATFIGNHEYDDSLPDYSLKAIEQTLSEIEQIHRELESVRLGNLTTTENMDCKLAIDYLKCQLWEFKSNHFHCGNPSVYSSEAVFGVVSLFLYQEKLSTPVIDASICRMKKIPIFLNQAMENIKEAPLAWIDQAIDECKGAEELFINGLPLLATDQKIEEKGFLESAKLAAGAFASYRDFLKKLKHEHSNSNYSCGDDAFELMMQCGHQICINLDEQVAYALDEIEKAEDYLTNHAQQFGVSTAHEALSLLEEIHPSVETYYETFEKVWNECKQFALGQKLITWPDYPIQYIPQPNWIQSAAPHLYFLPYRAPAAFGHPLKHKYFVTPIHTEFSCEHKERLLKIMNYGTIKTNHVIHHGSIGHHIQNWNAYQSKSRIGQIAGIDCASRIAMFCAGTLVEGWAVYVGELMDEHGFLTNLESYVEHQSRRRMSARTVVDIQLHRGLFTFEDAVRFYVNKAGMSESFAHKEVTKNSMFPGAAMMYLYGSDRILSCRNSLKQKLGSKFNLRVFHDKLLSFGSIPVEMICNKMEKELTEI